MVNEAKRYFYSDPVAAVWMAKHFGMKFSYSRNHGKSNGGGTDPDIRTGVLYPSPFCNTSGLATCKTSRGGELIGSDRLFAYGDLYIHPDSLHLLKAREGDVCWEEGVADDPDCGLPFNLVDPANHGPIMMRDGKPFFWPEQESKE